MHIWFATNFFATKFKFNTTQFGSAKTCQGFGTTKILVAQKLASNQTSP